MKQNSKNNTNDTHKEKIIQAMFEAFVIKGYQASLSDVAYRVDMPVHALYTYFSTKDELLWTVLQREITHYFSRVCATIEHRESLSCKEALHTVYTTIISYFLDYDTLRFWKHMISIVNEGILSSCRSLIIQRDEELASYIHTILDTGIVAQEISVTCSDNTTMLFLAICHGLLDVLLLYQRDKRLISTFIDGCWKAFWEGIEKQ